MREMKIGLILNTVKVYVDNFLIFKMCLVGNDISLESFTGPDWQTVLLAVRLNCHVTNVNYFAAQEKQQIFPQGASNQTQV